MTFHNLADTGNILRELNVQLQESGGRTGEYA